MHLISWRIDRGGIHWVYGGFGVSSYVIIGGIIEVIWTKIIWNDHITSTVRIIMGCEGVIRQRPSGLFLLLKLSEGRREYEASGE
ncbi:hypothetical protein NEOLEDRAFT_1138027 [Neolentinus lepideus HHB14362 ss-1]|uniref:Uncharacterized protein n=1 Tax=Neolentinus lepideus HHB14362 ss-1 TaxID=1314782 RepID=A0A165QFF0_9AGAM|nr:hypothetical protein NEOLEDRAFT_1138027 [Neolentinus lepideus HHB14362 ss-1]